MVKRGILSTLLMAAAISFCFVNIATAEGAEISIDVSSASLQLTVPGSANIVLNPGASSAFGTSEIGFSVATNNPTGYVVTISVPQTEMLHSTVAAANIPTLDSVTTEANFPLNKWGYKTTGDYNPVKLTNTDTAWEYDGPTNSQSHSLTLAAKVDNATVAGTYTNTLTFTAVVNPNAPKDTIVFNGNGADSGAMSSQLAYQGEPTVLNENTFVKANYLFNGWNTAANGNGVGYGDKDTYTAPQTGTAGTITLYAQWIEDTGQGAGYAGRSLQAAFEQAYVYNQGNYWDSSRNTYKKGLYVPHKDPNTGEYDGTYFEATVESDYYGIPARDLRFAMQDISLLVDGQNVCERTTAIGTEAYVLDLRDFKSYWIVKLKDGKCWMSQNLDYDIPVSGMTSDDSDLNVSGTAGYTNGYSVDGNGKITYMPIRGTGSIESYVKSTTSPYSSDLGDIYQICTSSSCPDSFSTTPGGLYGTHGHLGNVYNWTASAASNESSGLVTSSSSVMGIAENSICPKGWRLPVFTGANNDDGVDEPGIIRTAYGWLNSNTIAFLREPLFIVRAGQVAQDVGTMWSDYKGHYNGQGNIGQYWGSTYRNYFDGDYSGGQWTLNSSANTTSGGVRRYFSGSIRCIAR